MFIQTEATPNPATLKFIPAATCWARAPLNTGRAVKAAASPLAMRVSGVDGVTGCVSRFGFYSVTKGDVEWQHIKPAVLGAIMEHYLSGAPVMDGEAEAEGNGIYDPKDEETVATIKELLETRVRPAVANDGGDIIFHGFQDGVVSLHMRGACAGCPSSTATLRNGIENLLKHFLPGRARSAGGLIASHPVASADIGAGRICLFADRFRTNYLQTDRHSASGISGACLYVDPS